MQDMNYWSAFHEDSVTITPENKRRKPYTEARGTNTIFFPAWTWFDARKEAARLLTEREGYVVDQFSAGLKIFESTAEEHARVNALLPKGRIR